MGSCADYTFVQDFNEVLVVIGTAGIYYYRKKTNKKNEETTADREV